MQEVSSFLVNVFFQPIQIQRAFHQMEPLVAAVVIKNITMKFTLIQMKRKGQSSTKTKEMTIQLYQVNYEDILYFTTS